MSDPLEIYLNDHIGGARVAVELLRAMRDQQDNGHFRRLADDLLPQIEDDESTLRELIVSIGATPSAVKSAAGWLMEKVARLKLGPTGGADMETFEALEMLTIGITGKRGLWMALQVAAANDERLQRLDFSRLVARADEQLAVVGKERLRLAATVLKRL